MTNRTDELTSNLKDFLKGMKIGNPDTLNEAAHFPQMAWAELAKRELDRRMARVLEMLDAETLAAIAACQINPNALANEILTRR